MTPSLSANERETYQIIAADLVEEAERKRNGQSTVFYKSESFLDLIYAQPREGFIGVCERSPLRLAQIKC